MELENREQMPGDAAGMISDLTRCTLQDRRVACPQQMKLAEDRAHGDMQRARTAVGNLARDTELSATDTECLHAFGTPHGNPISRRGLQEGKIRASLAGDQLRMRCQRRE